MIGDIVVVAGLAVEVVVAKVKKKMEKIRNRVLLKKYLVGSFYETKFGDEFE